MSISVIGVDPGPASGLVTLHWPNHAPADIWGDPVIRAYQCSADSAPGLLLMLLAQHENWTGQIEHFVPSNLPNSPTTVRLENVLAGIAEECGVHLARHPMAAVKPWASDRRMMRAGLWGSAIPAKMVDARAAGRHALYCAVKDAGVPDPMSRKRVQV